MEFVLVLVSCLLLTTRAASSSDAVLDVDGQELRRGQAYRVLPLIFPNGGGLTFTHLEKGSCPLNVVQERFEVQNGRPVTFFPEDPQDDDVVRVGSRLYAMFPVPTPCPESTVWQVDVKGGTGHVITGGYISDVAGPHYSRFAISKSEKTPGYVLQSCPCKLCLMACLNLGVDIVDGRRLLSTGVDPLKVVFVKVKAEEAMIQSAVMHPKA